MAERFSFRTFVILSLAVLSILIVVNLLYKPIALRIGPKTGSQTTANVAFAENPSYTDAFDAYPKVWPPVYPSLLWLAQKMGIPISRVNQIIYYFILLWIWLFVSRNMKNIHAVYPVLLFAFASFNYMNMYQYVSETFFILLVLLSYTLLCKYLISRSLTVLVCLGLVSSMVCLTRDFGLFFLIPVVVFNLVFYGFSGLRKRVYHAVLYAGIVSVFYGAWLFCVYTHTGELGGLDRFGERYLLIDNEWVNITELTGLWENIRALTKTVFIDFFSLQRYSYPPVIRGHFLSRLEYLMIALVIAVTAAVGIFVIRAYKGKERNAGLKNFWIVFTGTKQMIVLQLLAVYIIMTIILWSIVNNDPIYSRYLYPAYVLSLLSGFIIYSRIKEQITFEKVRALLQGVYILFLMIHVLKCVRYMYMRLYISA